MFIAKNNDKIITAKDTREELMEALKYAVYTDIIETEIPYRLYNGEYLTEEQIEQKEQERIQKLFMTRSDFFDGTIKAFMANEHILLPIIKSIIDGLELDEVTKMVAINNFENALNFYRFHTIFTLLSGVPITIGEQQVIITSEQWDKFFDETNKKNPNAYKELLPIAEE